jgi:hypothetical protein
LTSIVAAPAATLSFQHASIPTVLSVNPTTADFTIATTATTAVGGSLTVTGDIQAQRIGAIDRTSADNQVVTYGTFDVLNADDYPEISYISIGQNPITSEAQIVATATSLLIDAPGSAISLGQAGINSPLVRTYNNTIVTNGNFEIATSGKGIVFADGTTQLTAAGDTTENYTGITGTSQVQLDSFVYANFDTVRYFVRVKDSGNYHVEEIVMFYDGTNIDISEYGIITNNGSLGSFTADVSGSNVRLLFTPSGATSMSIRIARTLMAV